MSVALVASFGEILSRNQHRVLSDILNRYLLLYLTLNGIFAYLTYHFLPDIAQLVLKPENVGWVKSAWGRVFIAAFGYLVIVRTKLITIRDVPIGVDALYNAFADYCLRHTNMLIRNKQSAVLEAVYAKYKELKRYQHAFIEHLPSAPMNEQRTLQAQAEAVSNAATLPEHIKCKRLAELLLMIVGTRDELEAALKHVPEEGLQ